jgi:CubicO group peptidase (beta-lactamase class C family)
MPAVTTSPLFRLPLIVVAVLVVLALLAACQAGPNAPPAAASQPIPGGIRTATQEPGGAVARADYWPTTGWRTADPASHGVDAKRLAAMMDYVNSRGLAIKGLVVIRDGDVVFEQYPNGLSEKSRGEVYSVTKSFASTLVGIAQRKGLLTNLNEKVLDLLPGTYENVDDRKRAMTLEDVLTMRSGLAWTEDDSTINAFYASSDPVKFILDLPMAAEPGTTFKYCSGCSSLLTALVSKATGLTAQDFAQRELLSALGITEGDWTTGRDGNALGGWGLQLTPREMAKLGYLFLRGGTWDGEEIVMPEWVKAATSKQTESDNANGYGYQWWTHPKFPAYMALGRFGQTIYVNPEKDLVAAIRAQLQNHDQIYYLIETYIEPAVN